MRFLTILSLLLVAVTMGLSLAHALELPGKLRLDEASYKTVQAIYYPGFTLGGTVGELGSLIALGLLLYLTPYGSGRFWWTAAALLLLLAAHGTYWLLTHPVNKFWVKDVPMSAPGSTFFSTSAGTPSGDWTALRNKWELSHVIRACLALLSLISIAVATSLFERGAASSTAPV
jgi:Domain of unknown function (DUF1772)